MKVDDDVVLERATVLYDGECGFCDGTVRFLLQRSAAQDLQFSPIQSEFGTSLLARHGVNAADLNSSYLVDERGLFENSTAILQALRLCERPWSWLGVLRFVPRPLRDGVYRLVARNRTKISSLLKQQCQIPTAEERARFVE